MKNLLEIKNLFFSYQKEKQFVNNFSFAVNEGEMISVIGRNGSGKSTLVKIIARVINNYSGNIFFEGKDIKDYGHKAYSQKISYLPQVFPAFINELKVHDLLMLGRYAYKKASQLSYSDEDYSVVEEAMKISSVENFKDKILKILSGGERQKILLALSLVQLDITHDLKGKILIVDEPLTHLDINYQYETLSLLKELNEKKNLTVIFVIHDLNLALKYSHKTLLMNKGNLVEYGEASQVITSEKINDNFLVNSELVNFNNNTFIHFNDIQ